MTRDLQPSRKMPWALWPFAAAFGAATRLRSALYGGGVLHARRLDGTVISVGNLTVGGTGKTPMVLWMAEKLAKEGQRPAILTRGYRSEGRVDAQGQPWSDEVALLRGRLGEKVQLGVGADRYASGKALAERGARWFILDDGFQHLALARDADVVLLDSEDPFGGGLPLPAGRLREGRAALERADVLVITRTKSAPELKATVRRFTRAAIFYAWTELEAVLRGPAMVEELPADRRGAPVFAFCGIGNPAAFFGDLRRWNFRVAGTQTFRDHHSYSREDLRKLERAATAAGAGALICTEKDAFNLPAELPATLPIFACRIRLQLWDPEGFWAAVMAAVRRNKHRQSKERGKRRAKNNSAPMDQNKGTGADERNESVQPR